MRTKFLIAFVLVIAVVFGVTLTVHSPISAKGGDPTLPPPPMVDTDTPVYCLTRLCPPPIETDTPTPTIECVCAPGPVVTETPTLAPPRASKTHKMPVLQPKEADPTMTFSDVIQAVSVLVSFLIVVIVVIAQHRSHGNLIAALTDVVKAQAGNKPALDLVEPLLSKLITPAQVASAGKLGDFLETLTDDQGDQLIEALKTLLGKATDGQPNAAPGGALPQSPGTVG